MSDVKRLARWTGWCDPCETERPLVLTERGQRGIRAWLRGIGHEDRTLTLTCGVCGEWQAVPLGEADPEVVEHTTPAVVALRPLGMRQVVVRAVAFTPYPVEPIPAPRVLTELDHCDATLELVAEGLDLIAVTA